MRVLQVHTRYREAGGEDAVVEAERRMLTAAGHEVHVHEEQNPAGARAALALAASPWNRAAAGRAAAAVRRLRPDVVHVHNTWYAASAAVPATIGAGGTPVVRTLHNYRRACVNASLYRDGAPCQDCVGRSAWPGVQHRCYRGSLTSSVASAVSIEVGRRVPSADAGTRAFLVLNAFMRDVLVRAGLPAERTLVHGNSTPDPGPRAAPPSASRTVLVVGRVEPLKGVDVLLEAWAREPRELELVVVGDGPQRSALQAAAPPGVRFPGRLRATEVARLLLSARALVLPSVWYEGQPMSVLEAMAAGTPVLASATGGLPEQVSEQGEGWTVARADPDAWARALRTLEQSPSARLDEAGAAARHRWSRDSSPEVAGRRLVSIYEGVLA